MHITLLTAVLHLLVCADQAQPEESTTGLGRIGGQQPNADDVTRDRILTQIFNDQGARRCNTNALKENPKLEGKVAGTIVVSAKGKVVKLDADASDLPAPAVVKCVVAALEKMQFKPAPRSDFTTAYVWRFRGK